MNSKRMPIVPSDTVSEEAAARKTLQRNRILTYLIKATEQLIHEEGLHKVTSRKIGNIAGYSGSLIYSYFEDINELILFASISYLRDYVRTLSKEKMDNLNARERYIHVTRLFTGIMFANPDIFYNMFFGPHRDKLSSIIREYYDLFPDEIASLPAAFKDMILEGSLYEREHYMVSQMVREGELSPSEEKSLLEVVVRMQQSFLADLSAEKDPNPNDALERFMKLFLFVLGLPSGEGQ